MTRALLCVAHPDDEVLFAGGLMLANPKWQWTAVCATHTPSSPRGDLWKKSIDAFSSRGVLIDHGRMLGLDDEGAYVLPRHKWAMWKQACAGLGNYDIVFTHNKLGEYGHPHHMAVHSIIQDLYADAGVPIWTFYCGAPSGVGEQEKFEFWHRLSLEQGLGIPKLEIMKRAYPADLLGLRANQPELVDWCFGDREVFTSRTGGWPS